MLVKILNNPWYKFTWHFVLIVALIYNGYFLLEGWKINKKNIILYDQNLTLNQSIDELKNQNSYENLESYKDKVLKITGYRKPGEIVIDTSKIDLPPDPKSSLEQKDKTNLERWSDCLFGKNQKLFEEVVTSCR